MASAADPPAAGPDKDWARYLSAQMRVTPLVPLLLFADLFTLGANADLGAVFPCLVAFGLLAFFRAPRWLCYTALVVAICILAFVFVFSLSIGPEDARADRDDQLEIAARGLLLGSNPWRTPIPSGNPNSTGPSSVLVALPALLLFDRINELTFLFYLVLFAILLLADVRKRNDTFPVLALLFVGGWFGLGHTLALGLDDLYYGYLALALAWWLVERGQFTGAGVCLAFAALSRLSYGFPVAGFVLWYLHDRRFTRQGLAHLGLGAAAGAALIAVPFLVLPRGGPADVWEVNPFWYSILGQGWPHTNGLLRALDVAFDSAMERVGYEPMATLKVVLALGALTYVSRSLARIDLAHPFWHLAAGGFVACFAVYIPDLLFDYMPFFVVPAFLAIAHSSRSSRPTVE